MSQTHSLTTTAFELPGFRITKSYGVVRGMDLHARKSRRLARHCRTDEAITLFSNKEAIEVIIMQIQLLIKNRRLKSCHRCRSVA